MQGELVPGSRITLLVAWVACPSVVRQSFFEEIKSMLGHLRELTQTKEWVPVNSGLVKPEFSWGSSLWVRGNLQEQKWLKGRVSIVDSSQTYKPGAHCTEGWGIFRAFILCFCWACPRVSLNSLYGLRSF